MSRDTLCNPLPPLVAFGDTVPSSDPPQECHILFEWPLLHIDKVFGIDSAQSSTSYFHI